MKKTLKIVFAAVVLSICLFGSASESAADSSAVVIREDEKECSAEVSLVFQDTYSQAVPVCVDGAELSLVKVADLNADGTYSLRSDFDGLEGWNAFIGGDSTAAEERAAADAAQEIAEAQGLSVADTQTTDGDGQAVIETNGGGQGVYLLYESGEVQGSTAEKFLTMNPVLVRMPSLKNNRWLYEQTVTPKIQDAVSVKIKKRAQKGGALTDTAVIGAELTIVSAEDENTVIDRWTTSEVDHDTALLVPGKYILKETKVPDGYAQADPISFEINKKGRPVIDGKEQKTTEIVMPDPVITFTVDPSDPQNTVSRQIIRSIKTGDTARLVLWTVMGGAALCVLIFLVVRRNKKR